MLDSSELLAAIGGESPEPEDGILERFRLDDSLQVPIELTDAELWANYVNDDLYDMDRKIREFLSKTRFKREDRGGYKTTASIVFSWIYGRTPEAADGYACRILNTLLRYYCTSYTGRTTFGGKSVPCVYKFSRYATRNKRPYSLRLRLEEGKCGNPWRKSPVDDAGKRSHRGREHSQDGAHADVGGGDAQ